MRITLYSVDLDDSKVMSPDDLPAPIGWDTLQLASTRNQTYDGFFREFTAALLLNQEVQTWVRGVIDVYGFQSEIQVTIEEYDSERVFYDVIFTGVLNLKTYEEGEKTLSVNFEDTSFSRDIKNREEQNIDYNSNKSLDETFLPGYIDEFFNLKLYGNAGSYLDDQEQTISIPNTSVIKAIYPFELFNKVLQKITNSDYQVLRSSVLGRTNLTDNGLDFDYAVNGALAYRLITTGLLIRGWEENSTTGKQEGYVDLVVKFKEMFNSFHKMIPLGMGIEKETQLDGSIRHYVVIEEKDYFYQNSSYGFEFTSENISKFKRMPASEYYFNSLEVGYNTFSFDTRFGSGEYNNKTEYSSPMSSFQEKLDLLVEWRADGATIEELRWHPKKSEVADQEEVDGDEDIFIIDSFVDGDGELRSSDDSTEAGFESVSGVYGENPLYYNLKLRPRVNIDNWAKWISVGLQKNLSEQLSFQKSEKLSKISTLLVGDTDTLTDGENINISDLNSPILTGFVIKFFSPVTKSMILEIQGNPYQIAPYWDVIKQQQGWGFLKEISNTPITGETNCVLFEIENPEELPGGKKLQENGDYKLQENGDYKLLEA